MKKHIMVGEWALCGRLRPKEPPYHLAAKDVRPWHLKDPATYCCTCITVALSRSPYRRVIAHG